MSPIRCQATALALGLSGLIAPSSPADANVLALATQKACMACHSVDTKLIGPSFKDIAARHKERTDAADHLAGQIRHGSQGVWGNMAMPPNRTLTEEEISKLAGWILAQDN